ncbi:MAG: carbon storage regulator CsrA [bacterium]
MLVLTRKTNESIIISDDIEIMVVEVQGDHVKLGINAPRDVSVNRKEVYELIKRENIEASKPKVIDLSELGKELLSKTKKEK